jgi:hypothetical protein
LRELDTAQLVVRSGLAFRFRETTGTRGEDFEAWLTLPDGREAACEVKGKIGRTDLSEHTILRSLKRAAGQVPKNHPAVLFVWLPEEWISKPGLQELLAKVTRRFFKDYKRVITVEYIWESWVTSESAAIKLGRMTKVREYVNRESRYFDERNVGLINSAPVLDPRGPWTTLDSFIAQYRDRAATAIASVEVDQKKIGDRFQRLRSR